MGHHGDLSENRAKKILMGKNPAQTAFQRIFHFYYDGFRTMSWWGKRIWIILLIKLFLIFAVLRLFFFPDFLKTKFDSEEQRSDYVLEQLINSPEYYD
ncbi:MAG: DUF4492 domain-containing protein [Bacteroidales bacterium]|jgi:hypothetical protein|nr:DUF4492 domain-containing protein [Bacteroidales bacterium]